MYFSWTSIFALSKMTLSYAPPIFLTAIRMLFAGFLLVGYLLVRKRLKINKKQFVAIALFAFFSVYLTNILEFWGVQHLTAAKTCFIYSLTPFFSALFSYLHFKEKMTPKKWLGLGIGLVGMVPVFLIQTGSENLFSSLFIFSQPELAIIGATLFSAYGWVLLRLLVKKNALSPLIANGLSMLIGGGMALTHSFFADSWAPTPIVAGGFMPMIKGLVLMTVISNIICYNLYGWLLKKYTATFMSFVGLLSPIFASLTEWMILGTRPNPIIFLSTLVVVSGLWLVYQSELKQGYIIKDAKQEKAAA